MRPLFFPFLLIFLIPFSSCKKEQPLILPQDLEVIYPKGDSTKICFDCESQVVIYFNHDKLGLHIFSETFGWRDTKERYPEVPFIIYIGGEKKEKPTDKLRKMDFPFPVILDPGHSFLHFNQLDPAVSNNRLIPYLVKNQKVIGTAEIGLKEYFRKQLDTFLKK
ncbi:hypothetical protein [Echinicola sediminis]